MGIAPPTSAVAKWGAKWGATGFGFASAESGAKWGATGSASAEWRLPQVGCHWLRQCMRRYPCAAPEPFVTL